MKKKILLTALFAALCAAIWFYFNQQPDETVLDYGDPNAKFRYAERKNLSPYAMFGDSSVVLLTEHERLGKQFVPIFNTDKKSEIRRMEFDLKNGKARIFDKDDNLIEETTIDPELFARFLSVDPKAYKYYAWSPYNYVLGNPILNTDPRGDTVKISHKGNDYVYNNGQLFLNGAEYTGKVRGFLKQTVKNLNTLASTETGGGMLNSLVMSDKNIVIKFRSGAANFVPGFTGFGSPELRNNAEGLRVQETGKKVLDFYDFTEVGSGGTVYWDPNARPDGGKPAIVLGHELFHGLDATRGMLDSRTIPIGGDFMQIQEVRAVYTENLIRRELGMKMRAHYSNGAAQLIDAAGNPINVSPPYKFD